MKLAAGEPHASETRKQRPVKGTQGRSPAVHPEECLGVCLRWLWQGLDLEPNRGRGRKESRVHYLGAMRGFRAATHCHCPRRGPGQISCRPEPGGLCTACDSWLHSLKNPRVPQMISVNQEALVLTGLPARCLSGSPTPPLPRPRFCIASKSLAHAHRVCPGAGKGPVGLSCLPGVPKVLLHFSASSSTQFIDVLGSLESKNPS